jgi:predicted SprT family Zn-dependent metalloprotease
MAMPDPTGDQFGAYRLAFDYFNATLFAGSLPKCLLNFSRRSRRTMGFFAPERWRRGDDRTHEISLNPDVLDRPLAESMGTLVHEMVHLWQQAHGQPSRSTYHNREWADKMEAIGLMPSNTGKPGGKRTGQQMTHYVIEGGPFAVAFQAMPGEYRLPWLSGAPGGDGGKKPPRADKVKYACGGCGAAVWGKAGLSVVCGDCDRPMDEED